MRGRKIAVTAGMPGASINRIAAVVPPHEVHRLFIDFAHAMLADDRRANLLFGRLADKARIDTRYSTLEPARVAGPALDVDGFFTRGAFPSTAGRMVRYREAAPELAVRAVGELDLSAADRRRITHVVVTSCTGFSAPGIDLEVTARCGLDPSVERTMIGFMGCYAALNALKLARHIVRSEPKSRVLTINLELCTLHLQETTILERVLSFLIFGDGCAASLVSADPEGLSLDRFRTVLAPEERELITWDVGDDGFDMVLSGGVPAAVGRLLRERIDVILDGGAAEAIDLWAVHPGGRTVLDAAEQALALPPDALAASRDVLRRYGNMSSATIMFVLQRMLREAQAGERGCGMAFGPGLTAETMLFHKV